MKVTVDTNILVRAVVRDDLYSNVMGRWSGPSGIPTLERGTRCR
jgi:hypothetical protein